MIQRSHCTGISHSRNSEYQKKEHLFFPNIYASPTTRMYQTSTAAEQAAPAIVRVFAENRRRPSSHPPLPPLPRARGVISALIKDVPAPPLQLRRMEYSVEVVWHERALC